MKQQNLPMKQNRRSFFGWLAAGVAAFMVGVRESRAMSDALAKKIAGKPERLRAEPLRRACEWVIASEELSPDYNSAGKVFRFEQLPIRHQIWVVIKFDNFKRAARMEWLKLPPKKSGHLWVQEYWGAEHWNREHFQSAE